VRGQGGQPEGQGALPEASLHEALSRQRMRGRCPADAGWPRLARSCRAQSKSSQGRERAQGSTYNLVSLAEFPQASSLGMEPVGSCFLLQHTGRRRGGRGGLFIVR